MALLNDTTGPLPLVLIQPDSAQFWTDINTRLRKAGAGRISPREWQALAFSTTDCSLHVRQPGGRLIRLFTGRSSVYAAHELQLTPRWLAAAQARGRAAFGLVPPRSLPAPLATAPIDTDLAADADLMAQVDQLAAGRHLLGGLARLVID